MRKKALLSGWQTPALHCFLTSSKCTLVSLFREMHRWQETPGASSLSVFIIETTIANDTTVEQFPQSPQRRLYLLCIRTPQSLLNLHPGARIGKVDRAYLDCRRARHEKFEGVTCSSNPANPNNRNLRIQRAKFARHFIDHTQGNRLYRRSRQSSGTMC